MLSVPVLVPLAVGLKLTLIVQLAPTASVEPQVVVRAKSPLVAVLDMVSEAVPLFFSVTV
jgi:hypothetical protein